MIRFNCPHCSKKLRVPEELGGEMGRCPGCKQAIFIPESDQGEDSTEVIVTEEGRRELARRRAMVHVKVLDASPGDGGLTLRMEISNKLDVTISFMEGDLQFYDQDERHLDGSPLNSELMLAPGKKLSVTETVRVFPRVRQMLLDDLESVVVFFDPVRMVYGDGSIRGFQRLLEDRVTLAKLHGKRFPDIEAAVHPRRIFIYDRKVPVEKGDKIERRFKNGAVEIYRVLDPGFQPDHGGHVAHYAVEVCQEKSVAAGADASDELALAAEFTDIRRAVSQSINNPDRVEKLLDLIDDLEAMKTTEPYIHAFREFFLELDTDAACVSGFLTTLVRLIPSQADAS